MNKPRDMYIGRWTPFHKGHLEMMRGSIEQKTPLLILVRDTSYDLWTAEQRKEMIESAMKKLKLDAVVQIIPDIQAVKYGRGVGYGIDEIVVDKKIQAISATEIRKRMAEGDDSWKKLVVEGVPEVIEKYEKPGRVIWLTGLSGSGKSTIADELKKQLDSEGKDCIIIDGDVLRGTAISKGLTFTKEDRQKNLERASCICKMFAEQGFIVIASFVSPYEAVRASIKKIISPARFDLVYVSTSLKECEHRDTKGLYAKARAGEIPNFTGISDPYEVPGPSESLHVLAEGISVKESVERLRKGTEI